MGDPLAIVVTELTTVAEALEAQAARPLAGTGASVANEARGIRLALRAIAEAGSNRQADQWCAVHQSALHGKLCVRRHGAGSSLLCRPRSAAAAVEPLLSTYRDVAEAAQDHLDNCCGWIDSTPGPDLRAALARLQGGTTDGP